MYRWQKLTFHAFDPFRKKSASAAAITTPPFGEFKRVVLLNEEGAPAGANGRRDDSLPGVEVALSSR